MNKLTRDVALLISALALVIGAIGPWVTVLGIFSVGPTNSTEPGLIVFGGIGLLVLSSLTRQYMRSTSIIVGLLILAEVINVYVRVNNEENNDLISPGWGLYLTFLTCVFLIASPWFVHDKPKNKVELTRV